MGRNIEISCFIFLLSCLELMAGPGHGNGGVGEREKCEGGDNLGFYLVGLCWHGNSGYLSRIYVVITLYGRKQLDVQRAKLMV